MRFAITFTGWYSGCNAERFPLITILKPGAKRLTIRHIDTTILTKVEENINLVVFDNSNLSFIIIAVKPINKPEVLNLLFHMGIVKK